MKVLFKVLSAFFLNLGFSQSTMCMGIFYEPEVPKCLREE